MEAFLRIVLPQIIGETSFEVFNFQGKSNLLSRLPARLNGYANWVGDQVKLLILVDRDDSDCVVLKSQLEAVAADARLSTRTSRSATGAYAVVNRIVIEELEAWYFGDWQAASTAYPRLSRHVPNRAGLRDPDAIAGGTWETLEREMQRAGYFTTGLRKIEVARAIAPHIDPDRNTSTSFRHFHQALLELCA